ARYEQSLRWVLLHRRATFIASLVVLVATVFLFVHVPKGFIPDEDQGAIFAVTEAPQGTSFDAMASYQVAVSDVIRKDPAVRGLFSSIAVASTANSTTPNQGRLFIHLKRRSQRDGIPEIIARLRPAVAEIPGVRAFMQTLPTIRIGGQLTKSLYQFSLQSPNTDELFDAAPRLEAKLRELAEIQDVTSDLQVQNPQVNLETARDKASAVGITAERIESALSNAYGSRWISTIYAPNNEYRVIVELEPKYQGDPSSLSMLYVRSANGKLVP